MCINNTSGEDYRYSKKYELSPGIYMNLAKEDQVRIVFKNRRKKRLGETKFSTSQLCQKAPHTINCGRSFENILYTVAKLRSYTKKMEESTEYLLKGILYLYSDTLD